MNAAVIAAMPRKHRDKLVILLTIFWDQRLYSILNGNNTNTRNDKQSGPGVIKLFSCSTQLSITFKMLISIEISRNSAFLCSDKPRMLFFTLINLQMPTTVGILMSKKNFMLS